MNSIAYTARYAEVSAREKALVLERGCFSPEENLRIFQRGYDHPRHKMFLKVAEQYDLKNKIVCDAGCGYGASLPYCHEDSFGIDNVEACVRFVKGLGLNAHLKDIVRDDM